jgi:hypothetical protein
LEPYRDGNLITVVTYQLPVPCGDCSVHLLVDENGTTLSAFIMDGGRNAGGQAANEVVYYGLKLIAEIHNLSGPFLKAWVVTHWDKDHYDGVFDLLKSKDLNDFLDGTDFSIYTGPGRILQKVQDALVSVSLHV